MISRSDPQKSAWEGAPWSPRDWQAKALPIAMRALRVSNPIVRGVTGSGKSILLAEIAHLTPGRIIVTAPSVNLVDQISATLTARGMKVGRYYTKSKQTRQRLIVCCNDSLPSLSKKVAAPELLIVDEAHKSETDTFKDVLLGTKDPMTGERDQATIWVPTHRIGFTATPYRADTSEGLSLFDTLAYNYGPSQAMRDKVVVPPRVVHYQGESKTLDEACIEMIRTAKGPGIVDAVNISDAEEFSELLRSSGLRAKSVHSKLHESTVQKRLKLLGKGELDCLVHVSLLSEGVDLPWLRWLCCRRPIGSRVLFAQYIGRGIRTFPGKKFCTVYDPQDLFGKLSLDYAAILSGGLEDEEIIPELPALELDWAVDAVRESTTPPETLRGVPVSVISPTVSYIRRTRLAFQSLGLSPMTIGEIGWRKDDPSSQQLNRISRDAWLVMEPEVPASQSRALRIAIRAIEGCDRGTASDLIAILNVLQYGWPADADPSETDQEEVA